MFRWLTRRSAPPLPLSPDGPRAFGWNTQWLSMPAPDPATAVRALGKFDTRFATDKAAPCNWSRGIDCALGKAMPRGVYFTPPQGGHVLALGYLPRDRRIEELRSVLGGVSRELGGRVCLLGSYRPVTGVILVVADQGEMTRAFIHSDGRTELDFGELLAEEREADFRYFEDLENDEGESDERPIFGEKDIHTLAGKLSIDPSRLGEPPCVQPGIGLLAF